MTYGFGAFFGLLPGGDVSSLLLIYGFPISLLGFALAYAQLKPVPCKTTKAAFELRDSQMTDIQKQVQHMLQQQLHQRVAGPTAVCTVSQPPEGRYSACHMAPVLL